MSAQQLATEAGPAPADPYLRFLLEHRDRTFYLKAYPGNSGDQLIMLGTEVLLERLGVRSTVNPAEADVILIPGGNPGHWPDCGAELWRQVWRRYPDKRFAVGPAGFAGGDEWREAIRREGRRRVLALFARDAASFAALQSAELPADVTIGLAHDPALQLRSSAWLEGHRRAAAREHVLLSFRDDRETDAAGSRMPARLPRRWRAWLERLHGRRSKSRKVAAARRLAAAGLPLVIADASKQNFHLFVESVRDAAEVHTDRLHVMLLAAMLGKPVFAYPTAYGKLEAVYRHSLAGWAHVVFPAGGGEEGRAARALDGA
ncbi:MAG TPA: polysaccharide pyruvyl transferase family protein [Gammaproteobacteria bacterium]